jgi:hypothetical protein
MRTVTPAREKSVRHVLPKAPFHWLAVRVATKLPSDHDLLIAVLALVQVTSGAESQVTKSPVHANHTANITGED